MAEKYDASYLVRVGLRNRERPENDDLAAPPTIEELVDAVETGVAAVIGDDFEVTATAELLDR